MLMLSRCSAPGGGTMPATSAIFLAASGCSSTSTLAKPARRSRDVIVEYQRPADAAHQRLEVVADRCRGLGSPRHVRDGQPPAGPEHPMDLAEGTVLVRNEVQHAIADHGIDGIVHDRQGLDFALAELDVAQAGFLRVGTGLFQHGIGHIDTDHPPGRPDLAGGKEAVEARPAAEVEYGFPRLQRRQRLRIAAGKPEIGPIGQRRQLGGGITECDGQSLGVLCAAAERTARGFTLGDLAILLLDRRLDLIVFHLRCPLCCIRISGCIGSKKNRLMGQDWSASRSPDGAGSYRNSLASREWCL